jgi:hypothetical protein
MIIKMTSGRLVGATCFSLMQKLLTLESEGKIIIILAHFIPSSADTFASIPISSCSLRTTLIWSHG